MWPQITQYAVLDLPALDLPALDLPRTHPSHLLHLPDPAPDLTDGSGVDVRVGTRGTPTRPTTLVLPIRTDTLEDTQIYGSGVGASRV